jgi:hypothetical protein
MHAQAMKFFAVMIGALLILPGCSSREIYQSGIGWRQSECEKILDGVERARCMETANKDYDSYERERTAPGDQR